MDEIQTKESMTLGKDHGHILQEMWHIVVPILGTEIILESTDRGLIRPTVSTRLYQSRARA